MVINDDFISFRKQRIVLTKLRKISRYRYFFSIVTLDKDLRVDDRVDKSGPAGTAPANGCSSCIGPMGEVASAAEVLNGVALICSGGQLLVGIHA